MNTRVNISLQADHPGKADYYFSLRLKQHLNNEAAIYSRPGKIFVVSDIEGNFMSLCGLLIAGRVVDKHLDWIYEDNHLVITGDCFDRGDQVTECLWLIYSLEERARRKGGYVHFLLGNHEIMNMNGDWRYIHPKYAQNEMSHAAHTALYDGNSEIWRWLHTKNIIEKIGDILFVHGGIAEEIIRLDLSVEEINNLARPYYNRAGELFTDPFLAAIYGEGVSPFWYRGYYDGTATEAQVDETLGHFGVKTIITGHTIIDKIRSFFNGKVINVDTNHAGAKSEGLLIIEDRFYRITRSGKKIRLQ